MNIILASKSPRRREILENLGVKFTVVTADTDENSDIQNPEELVKELAYRKANAVKEKLVTERRDVVARVRISAFAEVNCITLLCASRL